MTSLRIFPNIANASVDNFCCCCLLTPSASAILSIKASSFSCALSRNKRTALCSSAPAPPLVFFLGFFFADFTDSTSRISGLGVLVLSPFLFRFCSWRTVISWKPYLRPPLQSHQRQRCQAYPSPFGREQLPTSHLRSPFPANLINFRKTVNVLWAAFQHVLGINSFSVA